MIDKYGYAMIGMGMREVTGMGMSTREMIGMGMGILIPKVWVRCHLCIQHVLAPELHFFHRWHGVVPSSSSSSSML